jgi:hypothetical protein
MHPIHAVLIATAVCAGCANSASHEVVRATGANDALLDCAGIDAELRHVHSIIDGVEQDKKDMTGADVVDGILWFPFNVIAKQANYASASKAAHARIDTLTALRGQKGCTDPAS